MILVALLWWPIYEPLNRIGDIFPPLKTGIPVFCVHPKICSGIFFCWFGLGQKSCFQMWSNMLLEHMHLHRSNLITLVYVVAFDVETALENAK